MISFLMEFMKSDPLKTCLQETYIGRLQEVLMLNNNWNKKMRVIVVEVIDVKYLMI
jgi:hypothetical protein